MWYSILPASLVAIESLFARFFVILALSMVFPWAMLLIFDLGLYVFRVLWFDIWPGLRPGVRPGLLEGDVDVDMDNTTERDELDELDELDASGNGSPRAGTATGADTATDTSNDGGSGGGGANTARQRLY